MNPKTHTPMRYVWYGFLVAFCFTSMACQKNPEPAVAEVDPVPTEEVAELPPEPEPPKVLVPAAMPWEGLAELDMYEATCGDEETLVNIGEKIKPIAESLIGVPYSQELGNDCSGMFHKALAKMQSLCTNHTTPSMSEARTTRDLAKWYHEKGELILVDDVEQMAELIKPGVVVFFGHNRKRYENFTAEDLYGKRDANGNPARDENGVAIKGIVEHMGIVVDTVREEGVLTNYHMFHGRYFGKPSAITTWHVRAKKPTHPPFGNGNQQLIAVARLIGPGTVNTSS